MKNTVLLSLFFILLMMIGCSSEKKNRKQKPITTNLEKKAFVPQMAHGFVSNVQTEEDLAKAKAQAREIAIENRMSYYSKAFKDVVFYEDENNCILLSSPDNKGKGQGIIVELGGLLPTFYDFHYSIDIDDLNEREISCNMDKYDASFTLELNGKSIYFRTKGDLKILRGEKDIEFYKGFMERVATINAGKEVYGNPQYRITVSD